MTLKFRIEQVALCVKNPEAAIELLTAMGAGEWARDHVVAEGHVHRVGPLQNEADLAFDYELLKGANELEVLHYTKGENWMSGLQGRVSHLGMHCTEDELGEWMAFFHNREIYTAQQVFTKSHTNPHIKDSRRYAYVIFDTRQILGVDIKFIVRKSINESDNI